MKMRGDRKRISAKYSIARMKKEKKKIEMARE
jgi:hypothetical protein